MTGGCAQSFGATLLGDFITEGQTFLVQSVSVGTFNPNTMKKHNGAGDCVGRFVAGAGLIAGARCGGPVWFGDGVLPLLTALIGFCPAYTLFDLRQELKASFQRKLVASSTPRTAP